VIKVVTVAAAVTQSIQIFNAHNFSCRLAILIPGTPTSPVKARNPSIAVNPSNPLPQEIPQTVWLTPPLQTPEADSYPQKGCHRSHESSQQCHIYEPLVTALHLRTLAIVSSPRIRQSHYIKHRSSVYQKSTSVPTCKTPGCSRVTGYRTTGSPITRLFVTLLFFPQSIYTPTKVLCQHVGNIRHLQHWLLRLGFMCISASMGVPFAL